MGLGAVSAQPGWLPQLVDFITKKKKKHAACNSGTKLDPSAELVFNLAKFY